MTVIKRYPNRKLYDTNAKRYVTLDGIAELIRGGEEVQILDHTTGEDLTTVTLTQIILELEKKEGGFLPRAILTGLVQSGGLTLDALRQTLAAPLGILNHIDQEIERRLGRLVEMGELNELDSIRLLDKLLYFGRYPKHQVLPSEEEIQINLTKLDIPTHIDLKKINDRLEELNVQLDEIALER